MKQQRYVGRVVSWKGERGYGFISLANNEGDIFFHVNDSFSRDWLPQVGEPVSFELKPDTDGRWRAVEVRSLTSNPQFLPPPGIGFDAVLAVLVFVALSDLARNGNLHRSVAHLGNRLVSGDQRCDHHALCGRQATSPASCATDPRKHPASMGVDRRLARRYHRAAGLSSQTH